ncbi:MAG: hypothetical protein FJ026_03330 [Chloroflexi bacterium]|nr:hypothetical protein [Chloroflexota bacterium]
MQLVRPVILIIVVVVITLVFILGISLGLGWALTLVLPFSLFEGALLGMMATLASGVVWYTIFRSASSRESEGEESSFEVDEIPVSWFWKTDGERTWENWFRYVLANSIYVDLLDSPRGLGGLGERQVQELAVQLAETALGALKATPAHAKRLRVSRGILKRQMVKAGRRPYENDLLDLAAAVVNEELVHLEKLRQVVRGQLWDDVAEAY